MGTPLETPRAAITPSVKLREIGQYVDIALAHVTERPLMVFGSNPPEQAVSITGKPKTQDVIVGIVIGGTATIIVDDIERQVAAGDIVSLWMSGYNRYDPDFDAARSRGEAKSWSSAKRDHVPNIGDRLRWLFEAEIPGKGSVPKKVRTCRLGTNPDTALVLACDALNASAKGVPLETVTDLDPEPF